MTIVHATKKPVTVHAIRWRGDNLTSIKQFGVNAEEVAGGSLRFWVEKSETFAYVGEGDWIIKEPLGSGFYPCTSADFNATYDIRGWGRVDL